MRLSLKDTTILLESLFPALFSRLCHTAVTYSLAMGFLFFCGYTRNKNTITAPQSTVRKIDDVIKGLLDFCLLILRSHLPRAIGVLKADWPS